MPEAAGPLDLEPAALAAGAAGAAGFPPAGLPGGLAPGLPLAPWAPAWAARGFGLPFARWAFFSFFLSFLFFSLCFALLFLPDIAAHS